MFPRYTRSEQQADRYIHVIGVPLGAAALASILATAIGRGATAPAIGLILYGCALLAMLACSALYNLTPPSPRKALLRRLDHAAIFIMIAGTYTPFLLIPAHGVAAGRLLAWVWAAAIAGAAMKLLRPRRLERLSVALYLLLGWSFLLILDELLIALPRPALLLLAAGGLLYTGGVAFHLLDRLPYHNAIWHALVLAAAACHYAAIMGYVAS